MIDNMVYIKNLDQCRFKSQTLLHLNNTGEMISTEVYRHAGCRFLYILIIIIISSNSIIIKFQVQPVLVLPPNEADQMEISVGLVYNLC